MPLAGDSTEEAVAVLGNGSRITAPETVPFALWCAARHIDDYAEALWTTVSAGGDNDTNCAIVGGIVVLANGRKAIPEDWMAAREPLGPMAVRPPEP
jgi:ADP-ribosylglycohydrolase